MIFTCAPWVAARTPHTLRGVRAWQALLAANFCQFQFKAGRRLYAPSTGMSFAGNRGRWEQISTSASGSGRARDGPYIGIRPSVGGESLCIEHPSCARRPSLFGPTLDAQLFKFVRLSSPVRWARETLARFKPHHLLNKTRATLALINAD